jgi:hypothetical protein
LKGPLRFANAIDSAKAIKALTFLHNFLIENKDDEPNGINEAIDNEENDEEEEEENQNFAVDERMQALLATFKNVNNMN